MPLLDKGSRVTEQFKRARSVVRNDNARGVHLEIIGKYLSYGTFLALTTG